MFSISILHSMQQQAIDKKIVFIKIRTARCDNSVFIYYKYNITKITEGKHLYTVAILIHVLLTTELSAKITVLRFYSQMCQLFKNHKKKIVHIFFCMKKSKHKSRYKNLY